VQDSQAPTKIPLPWGNGAGGSYIRDIPTASRIGFQNGAASFTDGFPPLCFVPVATGGAGPFGQDMNGILFQVTAGLQWLQAGGPNPWDFGYSTTIGGYAKGAIVSNASIVGLYWISTADNNITNPDIGGAGWISFGVSLYNGAGNPNGVVAGKAAATGTPPDMYWDDTGQALWICVTTGDATGAVWQFANRAVVPIANSQVISAGAFSVDVPPGASVADITANGGGGGGGGAASANGAAAGGSGGAYFHWQVPVNGGSITGTVGSGGTAGTTILNGGNGGDTTVTYTSETRIAGGGSGGLTASGVSTFAVAGGTVGGAGFVTALTGYPSFGGVQGYNGSGGILYYGGTGGTSPNGGHGGAANITAPDAGGFPGGGGGGGASNSSAGQNGSAGAGGQASINFY
jgi:hypothetical protein